MVLGLLKPQPWVSQHNWDLRKHAIRLLSSSCTLRCQVHDYEMLVEQEKQQYLFASGVEISDFPEYAVSVCKYAVHVFIWNLPVPALGQLVAAVLRVCRYMHGLTGGIVHMHI